MIRPTVAAFALASLLAGQAAAAQAPVAQLSAIKGQVLVGRDGKLAAAAPGALKAGDRVVSKMGEAQLRYADGCLVTLKSQGMATITAKSPCAGGQGLISAGPTSAQAATAAPPPVAAAPAKTGLSILEWAGVSLTAVVLGVGLAAAADDVSISN